MRNSKSALGAAAPSFDNECAHAEINSAEINTVASCADKYVSARPGPNDTVTSLCSGLPAVDPIAFGGFCGH
jgi:hypothetical protein